MREINDASFHKMILSGHIERTMPCIMWLTSAFVDETVYVSPAFEHLTGYPCQALYEQPGLWTQIIHPEDLPVYAGKIKRGIKSESNPIIFPQYRVRRADGELRWFFTRAFRVTEPDAKAMLLLITKDMTNHNMLKRELMLFYQQSPDIFCLLSEDFYIKKINTAVTTMLGYHREEMVDMPLVELIAPCDRHFVVESLQKAPQSGIEKLRFRMISQEGDVRWLSWTFKFHKERRMIIATARDITEIVHQPLIDSLFGYNKDKPACENDDTAQATYLPSIIPATDYEVGVKTTSLILNSLKEQKARKEAAYAISKVVKMVKDNINTILPAITSLKTTNLDSTQTELVRLIEHCASNIHTVLNIHRHGTEDQILSPAEAVIVELIKAGKTSKEIAATLNLSLHTVATHRKNIRKKLNITHEKASLQALLS